MCGIR
ncbi:hypothetical protein ECPA39_2362, partial [Escherichia coli PA39]